MTPIVLIRCEIELLDESHPDHDIVGMGRIMAPAGFRATDVLQAANGTLMIVGLARPNALRVEHRIAVLLIDGGLELPIGVSLGDYLGNCMLPVPGGMKPAQVFVYGEWPKSGLIGVGSNGHA